MSQTHPFAQYGNLTWDITQNTHLTGEKLQWTTKPFLKRKSYLAINVGTIWQFPYFWSFLNMKIRLNKINPFLNTTVEDVKEFNVDYNTYISCNDSQARMIHPFPGHLLHPKGISNQHHQIMHICDRSEVTPVKKKEGRSPLRNLKSALWKADFSHF